jgi:purine nucleosidase
MGGTVGTGNATPVAEANIHQDAEAAKIVFESGVPTMMVDLTACAQVRLTRNDAARLGTSSDPVAAIADPYIGFSERFGANGAAIHDELAVGIAMDLWWPRRSDPVTLMPRPRASSLMAQR